MIETQTNEGRLEADFRRWVKIAGDQLKEFPLENRELYAAWLAQTYRLVQHSTRFLTIGASNAPLNDRALHYEMIHHLKGELNHDQVALEDLAAMGYSPDDFPTLLETNLLYQSQYYWLDRHAVSSMMGYALLLEGLACEYGDVLLKKTAVHGQKATGFVRLHAKVDVGHFADGLQWLNQVPRAEHADMLQNLAQSSQLYVGMLKGVGSGLAAPAKRAA